MKITRDVIANHLLGVVQASCLRHADSVNMKFPSTHPTTCDYLIRHGHCSHPFRRHSNFLIMSATTPGEMSRCRGTYARCLPQGQCHVWCGPLSGVFGLHSAAANARSKSLRFISFGTRLTLDPLYLSIKGAFIAGVGCSLSPRSEGDEGRNVALFRLEEVDELGGVALCVVGVAIVHQHVGLPGVGGQLM